MGFALYKRDEETKKENEETKNDGEVDEIK
jgi:hypothetical protein